MPRHQRVKQQIAQLRANGRTQEALELARQEAERGGRAIAEGSKRVASAARERATNLGGNAERALDTVDPDEGPTISEIGARIERASQARQPVQSDLSLTSDPRSIESFASSGMEVDAGGAGVAPQRDAETTQQTGDVMAMDPTFVAGGLDVGAGGSSRGADASADADSDEGHPLSFDDPFGAGGGRR